jgi:hypothetical protein
VATLKIGAAAAGTIATGSEDPCDVISWSDQGQFNCSFPASVSGGVPVAFSVKLTVVGGETRYVVSGSDRAVVEQLTAFLMQQRNQ